MKKGILCFTILSFLSAGTLLANINVTSPAQQVIVRSADDYAAFSFQDHMDMNSRLDLGWWLHVDDQPQSFLTDISFSNGIFSALTTSTDPNISILDSGVPGTCFLGRIGTNYPIDADKYRVLMLRMKLGTASLGQILWSKETIYSGMSTSNGFYTYNDWNIYFIDLKDLGTAVGDDWSGFIKSLRLDPSIISGDSIKIDWIRLVERDSDLFQNISWSGTSGNVDIYLDNDKNSGNGNLGRIAGNVGGGSYSFYAGGLPYGTYYIGIRSAGSQNQLNYSPGSYVVNDIPVFKFLSPSPEGSADDFATSQLNDPWDMNSTSDIDESNYVSNLQVTTVNAENEAGQSLGNISTLKGVSVYNGDPNCGDPQLYPLWWTDRGQNYHIDSNHYRILTVEMGLPGQRDLVRGSIARIVWKNVNESMENVSEDIVIRSKAGTLVRNKIIVDMKELPLESDPGGSPSYSGWNGEIDNFRVDPHEFPNPKEFYLMKVKLAAFERASDSYLFEWEYDDVYSPSAAMSLYCDSNGSGYNGTLIASGIDPINGSYTWDVSGLSDGTYYIYSVYSDGLNSNQCYAPWPIVVEHDFVDLPQIELNRDKLYFGALNDGVTVTDPQEVMVNISEVGNVDWQVSSNRDFIHVSPADGSGNGSFTVTVEARQYWVGQYDGTITLTSNDISNSPQYVQIYLDVYSPSGSQPPIGYWDTPSNGASQIRGSLPITGWALDDVQVERIEIKRRPEPEDPSGAIGDDGLIYVGEAMFVEGARPDLEVNPPYNQYPLNYRGGWGYMMLTYGLPRSGNGQYELHAIAWDAEGNQTNLGTKIVYCDNANADKPFGTIDTPGPGMTMPDPGFGNINFGWVLTPQPKVIPFDGSTIYVYIDGVLKGNLAEYGNFSQGIADAFPGYANTNNSYGHFFVDLGELENGVHTIGWAAYDNEGAGEGIGSRFFKVQNTGGGAALEASASRTSNYRPLSSLSLTPDNVSEPIKIERGFFRESNKTTVFPDYNGKFNINMKETGRIVIHLNERGENSESGLKNCTGYLQAGEYLQALPVGSFLDQKKGIFYWQAGTGFSGEYSFVFVRQYQGYSDKFNVTIKISPKFRNGSEDRPKIKRN